VAGPIPIAVAVEKKSAGTASSETGAVAGASAGRMILVGDSDFITNGYLALSGNKLFALNMVQWLIKDDRMISIHAQEPEFKSLILSHHERLILLLITLVGFPSFFLLIGSVRVLWRRRTA
jgi:ABC-type uncharacterized transport system involved in gliding motility auxiliary subunit